MKLNYATLNNNEYEKYSLVPKIKERYLQEEENVLQEEQIQEENNDISIQGEELIESRSKTINSIPKATKLVNINKSYSNYVGNVESLRNKVLENIENLYPYNRVEVEIDINDSFNEVIKFKLKIIIEVDDRFNKTNILEIDKKLDEMVNNTSDGRNVTSSNLSFIETDIKNKNIKIVAEEEDKIITREEENINSLAGGLSLFAILILIGMAILIFLFFDN